MGGLAVRFRIVPYATPFRAPVRTARGTMASRTGLFVVAESCNGLVGVGEAAPLPGHGTENLTDSRAALARLEGRVWRLGAENGSAVETFLERAGLGFSAPAARFGAEVALLDLLGRYLGLPVASLLGGAVRQRVAVNALLGSDQTGDLIEEARQACAAGFRTLKAKVGAGRVARDVERIRAVRQEVGSHVALRLDANRAWDLATAREAMTDLAPLDIEFIEEPLADPSQLPVLAGGRPGGIPLAADESAASGPLVHQLLAAKAADVVVLKPAVLGGLAATARLARAAAAARAKVVITSALDREVGVAAALHLACALPGLDLACGLATPAKLEGPGCTALNPAGGVMTLPGGPGLGIGPPPELAG